MAIAASTEAFADAGIDPDRLSLDAAREVNVILGTG
jgi:3-oxoacyl-(acyl-carrier-protein) synthase